ncbi:J domain-containing protein [Alysiella filiformis]|uniref:J domain-containing protein n=1 Tax=Alysiella filiformis DSM 16848 TaxID=1120981 RepID=A0A286EEP4_9NEIS|nr:hypothetical protein [Alysiella filiformis]QMT31876.1 hypothetical protein H3L97_03045 [Alysiella filiformis]UBQ57219.1 J domain-containing protein [Alysiella filiformis DSM 16848]SOD69377.1 hypothetical protein SAMN02746062_01647 [Alysiella filiformis DSM 16848]
MKNYYALLQVHVLADQKTLQRAIRHCAQQQSLPLAELQTIQAILLDPERKQVYDQQLLAQFPELLQEAKIAQQKQAEYRQKQAFQAAVKRGELEIRESTNPYFRFDRMPSFLCMLAITFLLGHVLGGVHGLFSRHMEHLAKEQARNPNNIHTACLQFVKTQPLAMQKGASEDIYRVYHKGKTYRQSDEYMWDIREFPFGQYTWQHQANWFRQIKQLRPSQCMPVRYIHVDFLWWDYGFVYDMAGEPINQSSF